jgi:Ca2+/H+ antiporter, TMEM165/GDT1 family
LRDAGRLGTVEALLVSTFAVAIAEIGDKTQLLSLVLAARYRRPLPIIAGIFVATIANHALAALAGEWIRTSLGPDTLRWLVGLSFLAVAAWTLVPDKLDASDAQVRGRHGIFWITVVTFFLAEMGDKTQVATVLLGAKYEAVTMVVLGTTLGMMIANVPAVLLGHAAAPRVPMRLVRAVAATLFAVIGIAVLVYPQ